MSNGNEILLKGFPTDGMISQQTNHTTTHYEQV